MMANKYLKLGKALYNAGKKKLSGVASKTSPKTTSKKTTPKQAPVKPRTIDFKKAKRTLAATAGVSAGVAGTAGYMAGKPDNKKSETPKKVIDATGSKTFKQSFSEARKGGQKEFTWNGKKYNTKLASDTKPAKVDYQDANPNKSNAPNPFKKNDSDNKPVPKSDDDKMKWAQGAMESAQGLLRRPTSMKKGGKVYCKDGCAVRGKTKGRII